MLSNVTIVVPTRKRYSYLFRLLKFFKSYNLDIKTLVLDSTPYAPTIEELVELLSSPNIIWKRYKSDLPFWDRIARGTNYIDTEYVTMCGDDDFIIPTALMECVRFLSRNPAYSSAHGLYFLHYFREVNGYYHSIEPLYKGMKAAEEETGRERIESYLSGNSLLPFYALHRTEVFRTAWTETSKYVSDWYFHELFPCCLSLLYGKMKVLPVFYASREPNTINYFNYEVFKRCFSEKKIKRAVEGVAKHLCKIDSLSPAEGERIASRAFKGYLEKVESKLQVPPTVKVDRASLIWRRIKQRLKVQSRLVSWFYEGSHPSIFPKYLSDFKKVRDSILSADVTEEELNFQRQEFAEQKVS